MSIRRPLIAVVAAVILFLVYTWDVDRIERSALAEIQEQQVLYQDPQRAVALEFGMGGEKIRLERESSEARWRIVSPIQDAANNAVINAYLENLRGARRQGRFPAGRSEQYGLDKPLQEVALELKENGETKRFELAFGVQQGDFGNVYATIVGGEEIFTVSEWFYRQSLKTVEDLRDRSFGSIGIGSAKLLTIQNRRESIDLERSDPTRTDWFVFGDSNIPIPADLQILERLTNNLTNGSFLAVYDNPTSTTAELGFDEPTARLLVDDEEQIVVGAPIPGREQFYARTADGRIGRVSAALFGDFFRTPVEWGIKRFVWMSKGEIQQIETSAGNNSMNLLRTDNGWIFVETPGIAVRPDALNKYIESVLRLAPIQLVKHEVSPEELEKFGFLDGTYRLLVTDADGRKQGFRFGRTDSTQGMTYVLREQDQSLWLIDFLGQKDVYKFRRDIEERRMIPDLIEKTARVDVQMEAGVLRVEKSGSLWTITMPNERPVSLPEADVLPFLIGFQELEIQSELLSRDRRPPVATYRLYSAEGGEPFAIVDLIARSKDTVLFEYDGRKVEVGNDQFDVFDTALARLVIAAKSRAESQRTSN